MWVIIGGVALVAGLVATVISLLQTVNARPSGLPNLELEMARSGDPSSHAYAVPLDAPFSEMPTGLVASPDFTGAFVCGKEQLEWLDRYGKPFVRELAVSMRNTAESGTLTLRDFKAEGRREKPNTPLVPFYCDLPVGGAVSQQQGILPTDNRSPAYWGEPPEYEPDSPAEGAPLVYDLTAGESALLSLKPGHREDFEGVIRVTVLTGDTKATIAIPVEDSSQSGTDEKGDHVFFPNFTLPGDVGIHIGGDSFDPTSVTKPFSWRTSQEAPGPPTRGDASDLARYLAGIKPK